MNKNDRIRTIELLAALESVQKMLGEMEDKISEANDVVEGVMQKLMDGGVRI